MKWAYVARETYDAVKRESDALRAALMAASAHARAETERAGELRWTVEEMGKRYDAMAERYHALAAPPKPEMAEAAPLIDRVPSIVTQAIKDESGGDPRLAAHLRKRANELKAEKKTPEEIVAQLSTWQSTEEETAA